MLVPVGELRAHPRNPRRGAVEEIRKSLRRFGQQRPLLALPDGTLVAGHHVWRAAQAEGWSHVAVLRSDLTEGEVEAYLLADNRLADLGVYDEQLLGELLAPMRDGERLEGTGYSYEDVDALLLYLEPPVVAAGGDAAAIFRLVLSYEREQYQALTERLDELAREGGHESYSATVEALLGAQG
jgi:site-specific DNA-methyltransferase (adenine-specific)